MYVGKFLFYIENYNGIYLIAAADPAYATYLVFCLKDSAREAYHYGAAQLRKSPV